MRYGGNYKSYGPQYTRGIQEGNGIPYDKNLWVTYSVNKEDMWISRIPVPVKITPTTQANSYRDWETDRKSTRLNSSHRSLSRMPSSA